MPPPLAFSHLYTQGTGEAADVHYLVIRFNSAVSASLG